MTDRQNAFDLLRLLLAISVLISHGILIGGYTIQDPLSILSKDQTNLAEFGVMGFFTLSGYLITSSFERNKSPTVFIVNRALRILPGFWVCLLITAFFLAPLIFFAREQSLSRWSLTGEGSSVGFFFSNFFLVIKQWSIKDVLIGASYNASLNGSLWTLFPEILCYFFTIVAGISGVFNKNKVLFLILCITTFVFFTININFSKTYGPTILILSPAFKLFASYLAGSLIYVYRDQMILDNKGTIFLFFFTLLLLRFGGYNLISPLLVAMTLINIFQHFSVILRNDISYGIYIYSFPIQQLLYQVFGSRLHVITFISLSLVGSVMLGYLSFILIEKPALGYKKKMASLFENGFSSKKNKETIELNQSL